MKQLLMVAALSGCLVTHVSVAQDQPDEPTTSTRVLSPEERQALHQERRQKWESMSEEERQQHRDEMRQKWESMSEEEREAFRQERRNRRHNRGHPKGDWMKNMTPEEREALREEIRLRRESQ